MVRNSFTAAALRYQGRARSVSPVRAPARLARPCRRRFPADSLKKPEPKTEPKTPVRRRIRAADTTEPAAETPEADASSADGSTAAAKRSTKA